MLRSAQLPSPENPQQGPALPNQTSAEASGNSFSSQPIHLRPWPHSPAHFLHQAGTYIITAGTYQHAPIFHGPNRLTLLTNHTLELAEHYHWRLQAWAVFPNHYHLIGDSRQTNCLRSFVQHLHSVTAVAANRLDHTPGRKIWFEYWETRITFSRSYFARLNYVHQNAVHHGLVPLPSQYPWCSAAWFQRSAKRSFYKTVSSFKTDKLNIPDDFALQCAK